MKARQDPKPETEIRKRHDSYETQKKKEEKRKAHDHSQLSPPHSLPITSPLQEDPRNESPTRSPPHTKWREGMEGDLVGSIEVDVPEISRVVAAAADERVAARVAPLPRIAVDPVRVVHPVHDLLQEGCLLILVAGAGELVVVSIATRERGRGGGTSVSQICRPPAASCAWFK